MSEPASISTAVAQRYATAVFELAKSAENVKAVEADLTLLHDALTTSSDLRSLIQSPIYTREEQSSAITALAEKMELSPMVANTLALMAQKRRLFVLPHMIKNLRDIIAEDKGEVTADVTTAKALTKTQTDRLAASLKKTTGKTVTLNQTVDETLVGGLIVKVGSKMIDTSIRAKLNSLQNLMKEVG